MSLTATYHGTCPECEQPISPGQRIERGDSDELWQHADCAEFAATVECVCERCWTVHVGECI